MLKPGETFSILEKTNNYVLFAQGLSSIIYTIINAKNGIFSSGLTNLSPSGFMHAIHFLHLTIRGYMSIYPNFLRPGCPSGYDAGLTNQTSLVQFPPPFLNFM